MVAADDLNNGDRLDDLDRLKPRWQLLAEVTARLALSSSTELCRAGLATALGEEQQSLSRLAGFTEQSKRGRGRFGIALAS
ncbi:hypothetical protein BaRGS_00027743 [Batillaria attramentaria]|uniref:Uncharacterized protein n=1 Tax=Batillaria attramentaria TaxID=370345 RepID=A0ABD0K1A4_9CAEN